MLITNLKKACGSNIAGLQRIRIIEFADIVSVPLAVNAVISGEIVLKTGRTFKEWQVNISSDFSEVRKDDSKHGNYYEQSLNTLFSKDRQEVLQHHEIMRNGIYAILYTDNNGLTKFIPKMENVSTITTGDGKGSNIYRWNFRYKAQLPAYIFTGTISNGTIIPPP